MVYVVFLLISLVLVLLVAGLSFVLGFACWFRGCAMLIVLSIVYCGFCMHGVYYLAVWYCFLAFLCLGFDCVIGSLWSLIWLWLPCGCVCFGGVRAWLWIVWFTFD